MSIRNAKRRRSEDLSDGCSVGDNKDQHLLSSSSSTDDDQTGVVSLPHSAPVDKCVDLHLPPLPAGVFITEEAYDRLMEVLTCSICTSISKHSSIACHNGHGFCFDCLSKHVAAKVAMANSDEKDPIIGCPICQIKINDLCGDSGQWISDRKSDFFVQLLQPKPRCHFCRTRILFSEMDSHITSCPCVPLNCGLCGASIETKDIVKNTSCMHGPDQCQVFELRRDQFSEHAESCPFSLRFSCVCATDRFVCKNIPRYLVSTMSASCGKVDVACSSCGFCESRQTILDEGLRHFCHNGRSIVPVCREQGLCTLRLHTSVSRNSLGSSRTLTLDKQCGAVFWESGSWKSVGGSNEHESVICRFERVPRYAPVATFHSEGGMCAFMDSVGCNIVIADGHSNFVIGKDECRIIEFNRKVTLDQSVCDKQIKQFKFFLGGKILVALTDEEAVIVDLTDVTDISVQTVSVPSFAHSIQLDESIILIHDALNRSVFGIVPNADFKSYTFRCIDKWQCVKSAFTFVDFHGVVLAKWNVCGKLNVDIDSSKEDLCCVPKGAVFWRIIAVIGWGIDRLIVESVDDDTRGYDIFMSSHVPLR